MDYFEISTPEDLYSLIKEAYADYSVTLSDRDMLFLVFSLNHLCEWIAGGKKYKDVCKVQKTYRTKGQKFLMEIWRVPEFKVINTLCNRSKHHLTTKKGVKTNVIKGFVAGVSKTGDSLSSESHMVNGIDIRDIFQIVISEYEKWFGL